ncbi:prolipoprotein diacylglyceryl transferase [Anaerobacillus sp. HL2]|nr:prolipoprotein diacylglyceryl transferase [Anaerobacillus sp. HL2]
MEPLFTLGPLKIYLFGMMIAIGASIGVYLFLKKQKKEGDEKYLLDAILFSFIGGVIGFRILRFRI